MSNNVFICHHSADVPKLRDLLDNLRGKGYDVRSSSLQEDKNNKVVHKGKHVADATVARYIRRAIKWAGTFVVLIGEHTHERAWVNYEIRNAHFQGKKIIGVYKYGCAQTAELPEAYKRYGTSPIGWNSMDKLAGMILGNVEPAELPDGTPTTKSIYPMIYINCSDAFIFIQSRT